MKFINLPFFSIAIDNIAVRNFLYSFSPFNISLFGISKCRCREHRHLCIKGNYISFVLFNNADGHISFSISQQ